MHFLCHNFEFDTNVSKLQPNPLRDRAWQRADGVQAVMVFLYFHSFEDTAATIAVTAATTTRELLICSVMSAGQLVVWVALTCGINTWYTDH